MPRHTSAQDDPIVFEDLHGVSEDENLSLEIDLDAEGDDDGITRTSSDKGTATGEEDDFDDETSSRRSGSDDDGDGDGNRDDEDRFSKKFQQRLKREQRAKRRERQAREEAEAENARLQAELRKQKKQKGSGDTSDIDQRIETVEADLEQAVEDGDSKKQVRLTSQLTDLKAEKIAARYVTDDDDDDDQTQTQRRSPQRNELADDWVDSHSDWYGQRGFARLTRLAREIDRDVHDDGFDPLDEEYYDELNSRLMEQAPELFDEDGNPDPDGMKDRRATGRQKGRQRNSGADRQDKRSRSTVAGADDASRDSAPRRRADSSKIELGQADFENMRRFGLNPKDPAQVKEYALNKRQVEMEDAG